MAIFRKNSNEIQSIPDGCSERIIHFDGHAQWEWLNRELTMCGVSSLVKGYHIIRMNTDYGVALFVLSGRLSVCCQEVKQDVLPGEYVYLPPIGNQREQHDYRVDEECAIVWFHLHVANSFWGGCLGNQAYVRRYGTMEKQLNIFNYIWEEQLSPQPEPLLLRDMFSVLMHFMRRELQSGARQVHHRRGIQEAYETAARNLQKRWTVPQLAKIASMSPAAFNLAVRSCYNKSPGNMLLEMRLTVAAKLISGSSFTLDMAAAQTGFDSGFSLSRAFKKKTGMSPKKWLASGQPLGFRSV